MIAPEPASASRIQVVRECFGVTVYTYRNGRHDLVKNMIGQLVGEVEAARGSGILP
jgi:hypothetical protein